MDTGTGGHECPRADVGPSIACAARQLPFSTSLFRHMCRETLPAFLEPQDSLQGYSFLPSENFLLTKTVYTKALFPSQGGAGYTIDEKMQVDKSNYLNTYGARLTGLEAQIKMQRSM